MESRYRFKRMGIMLGKWYFGGYNTFHYTHRLYMPMYALLLLHSEAFYKWAFWPLCMLAVDKAIGHMRAGRKVKHPLSLPDPVPSSG